MEMEYIFRSLFVAPADMSEELESDLSRRIDRIDQAFLSGHITTGERIHCLAKAHENVESQARALVERFA